MPEMADSGEDHGNAKSVSRRDYLLVADRAAGLNDGGGPGGCYGFQSIGEGVEGVGGGDAVGLRQDRLHRAKLCRVDAAQLSGAHTEGLAVARVDNRVGFNLLADPPGEKQGLDFGIAGCARR